MSFYATEMAPYTSFRIQHQADGPVRQFLFHDKGVLCLGPRSVHLYTRRGVKLWQIRCAHVLPHGGRLGARSRVLEQGEKRDLLVVVAGTRRWSTFTV